jgi:hypothetical protein
MQIMQGNYGFNLEVQVSPERESNFSLISRNPIKFSKAQALFSCKQLNLNRKIFGGKCSVKHRLVQYRVKKTDFTSCGHYRGEFTIRRGKYTVSVPVEIVVIEKSEYCQ